MADSFDVIIVGGGMVGAALALGLGRAGRRVALLDRASPPVFAPDAPPDLRVSALSAASIALLERLGAWDRIRAMRTAPFERLSVWEDLRDLPLARLAPDTRTCFESADLGRPWLGHIVENPVTQQALWDSLAPLENVCCLHPAEPASIRQQGSGVSLELRTGQTLGARLLVGADGAQSRVRELAGIGIDQETYRQQALVAGVVHEPPTPPETWQAFTPNGPRAYLPLPVINGQHWASLVWYDAPDRIAELKALDEPGFRAAIGQAFPDCLPRLLETPSRASFPLVRSHAHTYVKGRVALVGDAAHTINPLAGQGVNLGFQDVEALLEELAGASDAGEPASLDRWAARRRPANRRMMLAMDLFYYGFSNRLGPLRLARNLGLGLAARAGPARRELARYAMGLEPRLPASLEKWLARLPDPLEPARQLRVPFI